MKSTHILNASTNLTGFSFIMLTSVKVLKLSSVSIIDEVSAALVAVFVLSCFFSFLAIRSTDSRKSGLYETIADYIFFVGLFTMTIISLMLVLYLG